MKCTSDHDIALDCLFQQKADDQINMAYYPWPIPTSYCPNVQPMQHHCANNFVLPKKQDFSCQAGSKHITSIKSGKSCLPRGMRWCASIHHWRCIRMHGQTRWLSRYGPAYPKKGQQAQLPLTKRTSTARSTARLLRSTEHYVPCRPALPMTLEAKVKSATQGFCPLTGDQWTSPHQVPLPASS